MVFFFVILAIILIGLLAYVLYKQTSTKPKNSDPPATPPPTNRPPANAQYECPYNGQKGGSGGCMSNPNCMLKDPLCSGSTSCFCIHRLVGAEVDCDKITNAVECKRNQGRCVWSSGYGEYPGYGKVSNTQCLFRSETVLSRWPFKI